MLSFLFFCVLMYWLPTIIGIVRKSPSVMGIAALNFFLGWTVIGWIMALVWSLAATSQVIVHVHNDAGRYTDPGRF